MKLEDDDAAAAARTPASSIMAGAGAGGTLAMLPATAMVMAHHEETVADAADTALFSSFVDFGETDHHMQMLMATPSSWAASSTRGRPSPSPSQHLSDSELDAHAFLSPPQSSCSPKGSADERRLSASSQCLFPPSPAEPSLVSFCPSTDLTEAGMDVDLSNPLPWMDPLVPIPSVLETPNGDLIKLLRSDTANACQQLLSEPVRRKPGRKKKTEMADSEPQPSPPQMFPKVSPPSLPHVKSESDSDTQPIPAVLPGSARMPAALPLKPSAPPVSMTLSKRQERMVKNREAADQSRKRKREHLASLETHAQALITENDELRARILELEGINFKLSQENAALRAAAATADPVLSSAIPTVGQSSSLAVQFSPLMSHRELVMDGGIKKAKRDVFFGGGSEALQSKPLGAVFMVFFFSFFLFVFPGSTPSPTLTAPTSHPSLSSWSSKVLEAFPSRADIPRIEAAPAPLLLPGAHVSGLNGHPLSDPSRLFQSDDRMNSFVLVSPKATLTPPISHAVQSSLSIPLTNLSDMLTALSTESGLSDVARDRVAWLRDLLDQEVVADKDGDSERSGGLLRRVGPHLVPATKEVIPLSLGDDGQLPVVVEDYLAALRAKSPLSLPSQETEGKEENGLVEVHGSHRSPNAVESAAPTATSFSDGTRLFPSRFCPTRREKGGPILSLVANLPVKDAMNEKQTSERHSATIAGDGLLDPLSWAQGDLEQEFERWIKEGDGKINGYERDGGREGYGSFLQLDVEVVGARIVTWNDTL
ncbi:hypothetical protein HDU67_004058 [Dinochytrium kinnereticum]|nr:hypothetical protein HDU67_004058 [Dinochytrium kinnereticum]